LHTSGGDVVENAPVLYQTVNGARHEVAGRYVLLPGDESPSTTQQVGFQVGAYDATKPLVIDPLFSLVYSTYLGDNATAYGIAVDSAGNAYVTGVTSSNGFPTVNPFQAKNAGSGDVFVTKLNAAGTALVYSTYLGGSGYELGGGIAVDSAGNASVTGYTTSSNFPIKNAFQPTDDAPNQPESFVAKLNAAGSGLIYSTYLGQAFLWSTGGVGGIAVDGAGDTYVTGTTNDSRFPTTPGAYHTVIPGNYDGFVTKFNPTGSVVYSTVFGAINETAYAIAVDSSGNAYVTGVVQSSTFPTTPGAFQTSNPDPSQDAAFVTKLSPTGSALVYSTYLGSGDGYGIAVDGAGNAYVRGLTQSTNFPTVNAFQTTGHVFVTKLNAAGSALLYSTRLGGSGQDGSRLVREGGIAVDGSGNAYVTGWTNSTDFPTRNAFQPTYGGGTQDAFVARIDTTQAGNASLIYSSYLGGSSNDVGEAIAVDTAGNAYVAGWTGSQDFPTTRGAYQTSLKHHNVAFVTKIDPPAAAASASASSMAAAVTVRSPEARASLPVTPPTYQGGSLDGMVSSELATALTATLGQPQQSGLALAANPLPLSPSHGRMEAGSAAVVENSFRALSLPALDQLFAEHARGSSYLDPWETLWEESTRLQDSAERGSPDDS
jgi:hypothetical protein